MDAYLMLYTASGSTKYSNVVSFTFERERYRCYTVFNGVFAGDCTPEDIREVRFYLNGSLLHRGSPDRLITEQRGADHLIRVRSYSFTMCLGQNELEPGILTNANMVKLVQRCQTSMAYISVQSNTPDVNYVYVKEHTSLWEAMCVYTAKAYHSYPFIRNQNMVMCSLASPATYVFANEKITEASKGVELSGLISDAYTVDNNDDWTITRTDSFATQRHIARQRYYARDLEWAYDPVEGLKYHMGTAAGGRQYQQFTYEGFKGEQLCDLAYITAGAVRIGGKEIDFIRITGSEKGIFTTIRCYKDLYCG